MGSSELMLWLAIEGTHSPLSVQKENVRSESDHGGLI